METKIFNKNDVVYIDGISEFKGKVEDKELVNDKWLYLISFLETETFGVVNGERLTDTL